MSAPGRVLARSFYERSALEVAPELLNKVLVQRDGSGAVFRSARIVEVEAYRGEADPASHARRGKTARNAVMFGPAGFMYVYFSYGMHWCANAVCARDGTAEAVLIRAAAPVAGIEAMRMARGGPRDDRDLCSGPARLCQAFGITGEHNGIDLVSAQMGLSIEDDGVSPPLEPGCSGRVGIRVATEAPWRWWVSGDPNVSRARPAAAV